MLSNIPTLAVVMSVLTLASASPSALAQTAPLQFQCDGIHLLQARQRYLAGDPATVAMVKKLRSQADGMLKDGPYTVTKKMHPLPGLDPHDYVSLAPYYWPNPDTADQLPYIRKDGQRNPEIHEYDAKPFGEMADHVWNLALAGYFTGDAKYSDRATLLIRTWFFDPATRMNPNLDHAQLVKGQDMGRGTGIIESLRLLPVIDGVELLHFSNSWTRQDEANMQAWFRAYVTWLRTSKNGQAESNATNNHGVWYDTQTIAFMLFINDPDDARKIAQAAAKKRIAAQIQPSGEMPRELARTNAFSYSNFNLSALTELADLAARLNVDLWHYQTDDGRSIRVALEWLIPYATGQEKWKHQQISGTLSAAGLITPLRRAEHAWNTSKYEPIIAKFKGGAAGGDSLRFPPPAPGVSSLLPAEKPTTEEEPPTGD